MSWCRNSSDLGHSNILIDFIVLWKTKKPTNMNVPWVTLTGFSILWNILLIENGKKRKKEKNPSPCEATLFLSSFLSRLLVRKSLQEPLLPVLSLTQQPAAAASLCCVWVLPGDIIICKPMSAGSLERRDDFLYLKVPLQRCCGWRSKADTAVGPDEGAAMVCGCFTASV